MNEAAIRKQMDSNLALMRRKNAAYGSQNIDLTGLPGITVRLMDKVMRLKTLVLDGHGDNLGEAVADTLQDIANYAVIGQTVESGQWSTPQHIPATLRDGITVTGRFSSTEEGDKLLAQIFKDIDQQAKARAAAK